MAEPTTQSVILSWNLTNWVTITLMALVAFALIGLAQKWYSSRSS